MSLSHCQLTASGKTLEVFKGLNPTGPRGRSAVPSQQQEQALAQGHVSGHKSVAFTVPIASCEGSASSGTGS